MDKKTKKENQFVIGNHSPINGMMWALDDNDELLKFNTVKLAVDFLEENEADPFEWYIHIVEIKHMDSNIESNFCKNCKHNK